MNGERIVYSKYTIVFSVTGDSDLYLITTLPESLSVNSQDKFASVREGGITLVRSIRRAEPRMMDSMPKKNNRKFIYSFFSPFLPSKF